MRRSNISEPFDRWSHDRRYRPVPMHGLSWGEYRNCCHIERHELQQFRKGGLPAWLQNPSKIRAVLSYKFRAGRAETLEDLRNRAHTRYRWYMRSNWWKPEGHEHYRVVRACGDVLRLYARMLHFYKLGYNAREIGAECGGMSAPAVRQRLFSLNKIARKLYPSET
jgi:hypothetical protein